MADQHGSATAVIADRPPNDGCDWDSQCARCGSSTTRQDCGECGGAGWLFVEDIGCDGAAEDYRRCLTCCGRGGWECCLSGDEWCQAHPRPGREQVERGEIEWFVVEREGNHA